MNVCMMTKEDLEKLDKVVMNILRNEGIRGKQASDERLYTKKKDGVEA